MVGMENRSSAPCRASFSPGDNAALFAIHCERCRQPAALLGGLEDEADVDGRAAGLESFPLQIAGAGEGPIRREAGDLPPQAARQGNTQTEG